jgi:cytosine/adenosine deaminase-related metal-dependent hydrolase
VSAVSLINAECNGLSTTVRLAGSIIDRLGGTPEPGDRVVDLKGDRVLPGLINAHDHLQLNSFPAAPANRYGNASDWIAEVSALRSQQGAFARHAGISRRDRLFVGGLKNLLSGVTTVAHHDPLYPELLTREYPVKVVQRYGWSHSLHIDGESAVRSSRQSTPRDWPWIIHAAEGLDASARGEFRRLEQLGCIAANTLLVHGTALGAHERARLKAAGAGLIFCPSSNLNLFGEAAEVTDILDQGCLALGTDSRLSGSRDLFEEIAIAAKLGVAADSLERMVTLDAARLLRLPNRGELRANCPADLLILPAASRLTELTRTHVRLVMVEGAVRYGDADLLCQIAPEAEWVEIRDDRVFKALALHLAVALSTSSAREVGVELNLSSRAA